MGGIAVVAIKARRIALNDSLEQFILKQITDNIRLTRKLERERDKLKRRLQKIRVTR